MAVPLLIMGDDEEPRPETLVVPAGWRAAQVYAAIDKTLDLPAGTTRKSLAKAALKLPNEADGNPEGYLFPATYPLPENATPQKMLARMVDTANEKFNGAPVAAGAQRNAMNVYQAVTVASIVQAEAASKADMGKVARVIFNRLERGMPLQMDSTVDYALNRTKARPTPPTPRSTARTTPTGAWGCRPPRSTTPGGRRARRDQPHPGRLAVLRHGPAGETRLTADLAEHQRNVAEAEAERKKTEEKSARPSPA